MGRQGVKALTVLLIVFIIAGTVAYFELTERRSVDFRPVYLSSVSLNVKFSNNGPELLIVSPVDIHKVNLKGSRPILVVGKLNVANLIDILNVTSSIYPFNLSPKAAVIYNRRLIFLVSGDLGRFLKWVSWIIAREPLWDLGLYSKNSGVLLSSSVVQTKTSKGNWTTVSGELYKHQVLLKITVPGGENVEFSVAPLNGKLLDYDPTTSKLQNLIIHDRSSFAMNRAGWMVENNEIGNAHLDAVLGMDSEDLMLRYILNGATGLLIVPFSS